MGRPRKSVHRVGNGRRPGGECCQFVRDSWTRADQWNRLVSGTNGGNGFSDATLTAPARKTIRCRPIHFESLNKMSFLIPGLDFLALAPHFFFFS